MGALTGVTVVCWLLGTVDEPELHDGRLRMLFEKLVDTPVRGVVYERGSAAGEAIARGRRRALADPGRGDPAGRRRAGGGGPLAGAMMIETLQSR